MGYDMGMAVFKKKNLEEIQKIMPNYTFKDMYNDFSINIETIEDIFPIKGCFGKWVFESNKNIFYNFFEPKLNDEETIIINKDTYWNIINWLEDQLKNHTIYDCIFNKEYDWCEYKEMGRIYENMKNVIINFDEEFVIFQQG